MVGFLFVVKVRCLLFFKPAICQYNIGKDCGKYDFQCVNDESPERVECIPIYRLCDGVIHCHDGSDELNCVNGFPSSQYLIKCIASFSEFY